MRTATFITRRFGVLAVLAGAACLSACGGSAGDSSASELASTRAKLDLQAWPAAASPLPIDAPLEARIEALVAALTLEEKVGQIIQADIGSVTPEDVRQYRLGAVLAGGNSGPGGNERAPPHEWLALADAFYAASMDAPAGRPAIPILWGVDAVHGHNNIVGATVFPHNIGLGAARDPELIRRIGEVTAREVAVTGLDWTFAPALAVVRDDWWGRSYEAYSEDPSIVRDYAAAIVEGLQGAPGSARFLGSDRVIATAKHFLGDGGTDGGRDQGDNRSPEATLRDVHAAGYPVAIAAGVQTVMVTYSSWHGQKLHGHAGLLTGVLKERMGFDGFVVGDWDAHGQVAGCSTISCPRALNAGLDMFMAPASWRELYANTLAQVRAGTIPRARLDDAVRRILRVKLRAGVFDKGLPSSRPYAGRFELLGAPAHRALAREAVRASLVLLKNRDGLLPLPADRHLLVAGDGADSIPKQCGGWTLTWQGTDTRNDDFPNGQSIASGIEAAVRAAGGTVERSVSGEYRTRPAAAIVVFGEDPYAEFQGDVATLEYSPGDKRDLELLRRLRSQGIPVVAVLLTGRPLWVNPEINAADAFVVAWLPGSEGGGVADVLLRGPDGSIVSDFKGKLPFSWPATPLQTDVNRGDRQVAQFPFGYGLTYADQGDVGPLPEEVPRAAAPSLDARTFYAAGRPGSGWHWFAEEAGGTRVELTDAVAGPASGSLEVRSATRRAGEPVRAARWSGSGSASLGLEGTDSLDLRREANGQVSLALEYRVTAAPQAPVHLAMRCGRGCGASVAIDRMLATGGEWHVLKIPLACFERAGARMQEITAPLVLSTASAFAIEVFSVRLESGLGGVTGCPT